MFPITNQIDGRKYVGKKGYFFSKTKQVKLKKKVKVESDWTTYFGSNEELKEQVALHGPDEFRREILHQCRPLGVLGYLEVREMIDRLVLETDTYYNGWVMAMVRKTHLKALYAIVL